MNRHVNKRNSKEIGLYLLTGLWGSLVDLAIFAFSLWLGLPVIFAQWAGAGVGAVHNSLIHHYFVFTHSKKLRHTVFPNTLLSLATVFLSGPILVILDSWIGNVWLSKALVLGLIAASTYLVRKLMIFNK